MDPITLAISAAGIGMSLFGAAGAMDKTLQESALSGQETQISQGITGLQIQENQQRQLAMQISARRQQTETIRKTQMARAQGLAAGVSQTGGTSSSGIAGGQAQAQGEGEFNLLGTNQNLQIGNQLFGIQNQISQGQIAMSGIQGQMNNLQGQASIFSGVGAIGGSLANSAGPLGNILGNWFGNKEDTSAVLPGGSPLGQGGIGSA